MRKVLFIILLLSFLYGCKNHQANKWAGLKFEEIRHHHAFCAKTDSGFVLRFPSLRGWVDNEYVIKNNEIIMYSDSMYKFDCMFNLSYSDSFYVRHLEGFRKGANCAFELINVVGGRFKYNILLSDYNYPEHKTFIKGAKISVNGLSGENFIEMDLVEINRFAPKLDSLLYENNYTINISDTIYFTKS